MGKSKTMTEREVLTLIANNKTLRDYYETYVEKKLCEVMEDHHDLLRTFDFDLRIGNIYVNYVRESYWTHCNEKLMTQLRKLCDLGYVTLYGLKRCTKLAIKNSNLLEYYFEKLVKELSNEMVVLCDDFEYQLCTIINGEVDDMPTNYLEEFLNTNVLRKGRIVICER